MSSFVFQTGATSKTINVRAYIDTTFLPKTALVYNSAGMTAYYREGATGTATAITLATQTVGGAYSSGGFVLIDDTNMPGVYRLDLPNAVLDAGAGSLVTVHLKATNVVFEPIDIVLTADDPTAAAATTAQIADAVWDEATSGHVTAGTTAVALTDVLADTGTDGVKVASGAIVAASFGAGAIDAAAIGVGAIAADAFAAGAIDAAAISADAGAEIADALLNRDMATGTDSGSTTVRTVRQALRALRNKVSVAGGTATITKEDDSTASWTAAVTGTPTVTAVDPAGP